MLKLANIESAKCISKLAIPMILVRLFYILINMIGMVLIARLGHLQLAAGALITAMLNTVMVIAMSPIISVGIIASRYFGSQEYERIGILLRNAFLVTAVIAMLVFTLLWKIAFFLSLFKQPVVLIPYVKSYIHAFAWGILPSLLMMNLHQLCLASRKQRLVFIWSAMSLGLTVFLGLSLLHGFLGLPKLGMIGWAYAITISSWLMLVGVIVYLGIPSHFKMFKLFNFKNYICKQEMAMIRKLGVPITIQISGELVVFSIINIMVGWIGVQALSVQQIILQCMVLVLMLPMGIGQSGAILIGQAIGQENTKNIQAICATCFVIIVGCMAFICAIYIAAPKFIIGLFTQLSQVGGQFLSLAILMLMISAVSQMADAIRNVQVGLLRGLHDMWLPMALNLATLLLALPLAYIMCFVYHLGLEGINLAYMSAFIVGGVLTSCRLHLKLKPIRLNQMMIH